MKINIEKTVHAGRELSSRAAETARIFGLRSQREMTVVPPRELHLPAHGIVFLTGPSGGGKSTILRLIVEATSRNGAAAVSLDDLPPPADVAIVDLFQSELPATLHLLSRAGLADAFVMLRTPGELSDGQRSRLEIARLMEKIQLREQTEQVVVIADEFAATLDRPAAHSLAANLRRWMNNQRTTDKCNILFLCATTHDDLFESLQPDLLIYKDLGDEIIICEEPDRYTTS